MSRMSLYRDRQIEAARLANNKLLELERQRTSLACRDRDMWRQALSILANVETLFPDRPADEMTPLAIAMLREAAHVSELIAEIAALHERIAELKGEK